MNKDTVNKILDDKVEMINVYHKKVENKLIENKNNLLNIFTKDQLETKIEELVKSNFYFKFKSNIFNALYSNKSKIQKNDENFNKIYTSIKKKS